jgi:hypothetical protein
MAPMILNTSRTRTVAESAVLAATICLAVLSCSDNTSVKHGPPAMFTMVSGDAQFGVIKTALPRAFIVKVTDADSTHRPPPPTAPARPR